MKTKIEAINWSKSKINKGIDWDDYYGYQCMAKVIKNTPSFYDKIIFCLCSP